MVQYSADGCRFKGTELSPKGLGRCAHVERIGTLAKGKNGAMWVVAADKNGRKYWKRQSISSTSATASSLSSVSIKNTKTKTQQTGIKIRIGEVYTGSFMKSFVELQINETFFKKLTKRPKILRRDGGFENAYVFGPLFDAKEYTFMGHHYNDGAQTGIVLMNSDMKVRDITNRATWKKVMDMYMHRGGSWDAPRVLQTVKKEASRNIVFVGDTDGGDGGADVYIHRHPSTGEIDSLIIDNGYFFELSG